MAGNDITKWVRSEHKCPVCYHQLWKLPITDNTYIYWCGVSPCPSIAANNGASTIEELRRNVDEEPEYRESEE